MTKSTATHPPNNGTKAAPGQIFSSPQALIFSFLLLSQVNMVHLTVAKCIEELDHVIDNLATFQPADATILRSALMCNDVSDMPSLLGINVHDFENLECDRPTGFGDAIRARRLPHGNTG